MIYRSKLGLQNCKPTSAYSPLHSPTNRKKTSNQTKLSKCSPNITQKNIDKSCDQKQLNTERLKQQKYFKISKQGKAFEQKKLKSEKPPLSISVTLSSRQLSQIIDFAVPNIETPKFKCSSHKLPHQRQINVKQNYFSFGDQLRQNMSILKQTSRTNLKHPLQQNNTKQNQRVVDDQTNFNYKFNINSLKKRQKQKQPDPKLQSKYFIVEKQNKFKKDKNIFYAKK